MLGCQVLSAHLLWLNPVRAGNQPTGPACQTCLWEEINAAKKALPSGNPKTLPPCVRASDIIIVTLSVSDIIISPRWDVQGLHSCAPTDTAEPGMLVLPQPTAKTSGWFWEVDRALFSLQRGMVLSSG